MEEIKVLIELEEEVKQDDRCFIEDAINDAITKLGWTVVSVRVRF